MRPAVRVTAPATSANLGPGFDAFGLALGLHDVVEASLAGPAANVTVEGTGAHELPRDESHLVVRAMVSALEVLGETRSPLQIHCRNSIPHGRGLGSSAAAIVTGVLAARALVEGGEERMGDDAVLALAARIEGHPDNVAPCLLGGFTIAWTSGSGARAVRLDVHPDIRPVLCVPPVALSTQAARGLLPAAVPHADAAGNAGRAALLVEALTRRPDLLLDATEDRLHQAYREPSMPETLALVTEMRSRGLPAVVSGAGPSVLVLATPDQVGRVTAPRDWETRLLPVADRGAIVETA